MSLKIDAVYNNLSETEKRIADYFLIHENEIASANIHNLAATIGTSPSSITRFVQKVYGKSFSQAKIEIARQSESDLERSSALLGWNLDYRDMPNKVIFSIQEVCQEVISYNGMDTFEKAVDLIIHAETIYLVGIGSSGIVAQDFFSKLIKLQRKVIYVIDSHFNIMTSLICGKNDVVVALSNSGQTREVCIACEHMKQNGAKIISVTGNIDGKLKRISDIAMVYPHIEDNSARIGAIISRYGQLFIIDLLFIGIAKSLRQSPSDLLQDYKELLIELNK